MRASSTHRTSLASLTNPRSWARAAVAASAIALPAHFAVAQGGPDQPEFLTDVAAGQEARMTSVAAAVRQRNVGLNLDLLGDDRTARQLDGLTLSLFEDTVVSGDVQSIDAAYGGGYIVELDVDNDPHGHVYLSVMGQSVTATIRTSDRLYQIHPVGIGGQHTVSEVDETRQPTCGTPHATPGGVQRVLGAPVAATSSEIVDMVVAYTDDARANYGGFDGILSLVNLAVFETNQGYANSNVNLRVNLVYTNEVSFSEVGSLSTWVSQLRNVDGVIDEVHQWRDTHGADAVCLITNSGAGFCGQAYRVLTVLSSAGAADAFNVTAAGCATGNYTFGHELGHTLGCQHDKANTGGSAIYPYCYGYRTGTQVYRTIMSYSPGSRINFWSNPSVEAPNGEVLGVTNSEENWRVLNNVASTATAWRTQKNSGQSIKTTFKSDNGFAGNMFNVTPKEDIEFTAVSINTSAATSTAVSARVWYRHGSYFSASSTSAGWCLIGTGSGSSAGRDRPTKLNFRSTQTLRADTTYGIYVELLNYSSTNVLRYTNGNSPDIYENSQLRLVMGIGKDNGGFTGGAFLDRIWNGRIHYRGGTGTQSLSTTFAGGNRFAGNMFTVTPSKSLTINSFDLNVNGSGDVTVDVWRRTGSYIGRENNASGWTYLGSEFKATSAGLGAATRIAVGDIDLNAGTTYSFYILLSSYPVQSLEYTNGSASYTNSDMTIATGIGTDDVPFSGSTFGSRTWNGRIHYTLKGTLSTFGSGCLGTNGVPSMSATGSPTMGNIVTYNLTGGPRNGTAFITLGNSKAFWGVLPLPALLTSVGATGCSVYSDHDLVIGPLRTSSSGRVSQPIGIANQCGLIGVHLYTQFIMIDPGANPLSLTTSNSVDALLSH